MKFTSSQKSKLKVFSDPIVRTYVGTQTTGLPQGLDQELLMDTQIFAIEAH